MWFFQVQILLPTPAEAEPTHCNFGPSLLAVKSISGPLLCACVCVCVCACVCTHAYTHTTETDLHLCLWAHLLLVPYLPWSIPHTCFQCSKDARLNFILGPLPYFLGSLARHWKDTGWTSASLSMSFEVEDFSVFLVLNRVPLGFWVFNVFPCS